MADYKFICSKNPKHVKILPYFVRICPLCGKVGDSEKLPEKTAEQIAVEKMRDKILGNL
jgi:hypothetical protein